MLGAKIGMYSLDALTATTLGQKQKFFEDKIA